MKKKWREKFLNIKVGKLHNANKQEQLNKNERHSKDWNWKYWINRICFFSGVSFTFDYGKGNAQFRKLSLFIFLNSRETTLWLPFNTRTSNLVTWPWTQSKQSKWPLRLLRLITMWFHLTRPVHLEVLFQRRKLNCMFLAGKIILGNIRAVC